MQLLGVGVDVVNIDRFEAALRSAPRLREKLFAPDERWLSLESLAVRFAAKEAVAKALGSPGGLRWHDCVVSRESGRPPRLELSGTVAAAAADRGITEWHISLAHDSVAIAMVMGLGKPPLAVVRNQQEAPVQGHLGGQKGGDDVPDSHR